MNARSHASQILTLVTQDGRSLDYALEQVWAKQPPKDEDSGLIRELCYGSLRYYHQLNAILKQLLTQDKPMDAQIHMLLIIGLYQLLYMRTPDHAATHETVEAARALKKNWAASLINAVLRNFQRKKEMLLSNIDKDVSAKHSHPKWLINAIKEAWPKHWASILSNNNKKPPLSLRVNTQKISRDDYLNNVSGTTNPAAPQGLVLEKASDVASLPGFSNGELSVQDYSAQQAASLLDLQDEQIVLDACCAPGGKTTHLLEINPSIYLTAVDNSKKRLTRVKENLKRLSMENSCKLMHEDLLQIKMLKKNYFDRILLDAPCSSTGVIRRHPDIKLLRKPQDIKKLAEIQLTILNNCWALLKNNGKLLYATCSVLPEECENIIDTFLKNQPHAKALTIDADWGTAQTHGRQILPAEEWDGFYYCLLSKKEA